MAMIYNYGIALSLLLVGAPPATAQEREPDPRREELRMMVRDILLSDPQLLQDSLNNLATYQKKSEAAFAEKLKKYDSYLADDGSAYLGSKSSRDVITVFSDFNCKFCAQTAQYLKDNLQDRYKIIVKDLPILGENSLYVAKYAIVAAKMHAYQDFYFATFSMPHASKEDMRAICRHIGLDPDAVEKEAAQPWVAATLEKNRAVASELGVNATPTLIYEGKKLGGGFKDISRMIPKAGAAR